MNMKIVPPTLLRSRDEFARLHDDDVSICYILYKLILILHTFFQLLRKKSNFMVSRFFFLCPGVFCMRPIILRSASSRVSRFFGF